MDTTEGCYLLMSYEGGKATTPRECTWLPKQSSNVFESLISNTCACWHNGRTGRCSGQPMEFFLQELAFRVQWSDQNVQDQPCDEHKVRQTGLGICLMGFCKSLGEMRPNNGCFRIQHPQNRRGGSSSKKLAQHPLPPPHSNSQLLRSTKFVGLRKIGISPTY